MPDLPKTLVINAVVFSTVSLAQIEMGLKIVLLLASIGYTFYKWRCAVVDRRNKT